MKLIPFTFHNVSINSGYLLYESKPYPHYLHSIMYLLIRWHNRNIIVSTKFTFHNVSINSIIAENAWVSRKIFTFHNVSINSQTIIFMVWKQWIFTFHNVSINSLSTNTIYSYIKKFTFHNVSINSPLWRIWGFSRRGIYIP